MQVRIKSEHSDSSYYFDDIPFNMIDDFVEKIYRENFYFENENGEQHAHTFMDCSYTINEHGAHLEVVFETGKDFDQLNRI